MKENEIPKDSSVQRVSKSEDRVSRSEDRVSRSEDRVSKLVSVTPGKVKSKAPQPPGSSNRINELVKGQETSNSQRPSTDSSDGGGSKVSQNLSKSLDNVSTEFSSSKKKGPAPVAPTSSDHRREVKSDPSHDLVANERRENELPEEITVSSNPTTLIGTIENGRIPKPGEIVPTDDSNESVPAVVTSFHGNGGQQQQSPLQQDTAHVSVITIDDNGKDVTIKTSNREEMTSFLSQPDGDGASGNLVPDPRTTTQSSGAKEVIVISNDSSFIPHHHDRYQDPRFIQPNDGSLPRSVAISYDEDRISIRTESSDNSYPSSDLRGPIDHISSSIRSSDSRGNHKNGFQRTSSDGQRTRSNGSTPGMAVSKANELLHREVSDAGSFGSFASDRDRSDRDRPEWNRDRADRGKQEQKQESKSTSSSSQHPSPPDAKQSSDVVLRRKKVRTVSQFDPPHHTDRFSSLLSRSSAFSILRALSSMHSHPAHSFYLPQVPTPTHRHTSSQQEFILLRRSTS